MKNILGFSALVAATEPFRRESTRLAPPTHRGPPSFIIPHSEFGQTTWSGDPARPSDGWPSQGHPPIAASRYSSTVFEQLWSTTTVIQHGEVSISTVFLTSAVTWTQTTTQDLPGSIEITITVERTVPVPNTVYQQHTTTAVPSTVCSSLRPRTTPNAAVCDGKGCEITFEKGAIVHWQLLPHRTPLVTRYLHSTCVAVVCNITEFSLYYSRSATSCDRPPCPSNSLNCECNIVVGPFRLPDGRITSVTQTGTSGWNLNLGPHATARNIGYCGLSGPVCDAVTTTLFTALVYTEDVKVISATAWRNDSGAEATDFLLPHLTDYFPANDPLGMCTSIKLSLNFTTASLGKRDDVATVGGDGITTWPGCETLTDDANAKRGLVARQTIPSDVNQLLICSDEKAVSTTTVTATIHRDTGTATASETQARSAAAGLRLQHMAQFWLLPLLVMLQHVRRV